jgi:hypothetical protein
MIGRLPVPTALQALLLLVVVLVEAVVLYVGYGYVEGLLAPRLLETIENS